MYNKFHLASTCYDFLELQLCLTSPVLTSVSQIATVSGSATKAKADARRLLAAHKQEVTSSPWTNRYGPPQANNFLVGALPQNIHADLAADLGVTIHTNPQRFIVNPIGHTPR